MVSFSAGNIPKVHLIINPTVPTFLIYSISYASFRFLQILSLGGTQPLVPAETVLLTVQGEPREQKSSIDTQGDHFVCSSSFCSLGVFLWVSKLLWHLGHKSCLSWDSSAPRGNVASYKQESKAFCTGINPIHYGGAHTK